MVKSSWSEVDGLGWWSREERGSAEEVTRKRAETREPTENSRPWEPDLTAVFDS